MSSSETEHPQPSAHPPTAETEAKPSRLRRVLFLHKEKLLEELLRRASEQESLQLALEQEAPPVKYWRGVYGRKS